MDNQNVNQTFQVPTAAPSNAPAPAPSSAVQYVQPVMEDRRDISGLIKTIAIIVLSLCLLTFIGLFIWMYIQYDNARDDVEGQVSKAVSAAVEKKAEEMEAEFLEREKSPYTSFSGPADYGELSFKYPKTWSVYVAADASNGGDFEAYLNPRQVDMVSKNTINALRVTIRNKSFDDVSAEYQKFMQRSDSDLRVESVTIGNGIPADRYSGTIPETDLNGYIVIFKIRDKTAILRTDSVLFREDFETLLQTIKFNA